ncbi:MAG TPA: amidohydrolase family protein [Bacteroidia bacterium]|jgi:cytosine/adenosine deaminase-related metal-dependent hydrolase|nr:amidohydrolase family protein [Bacteroidia bacterium]
MRCFQADIIYPVSAAPIPNGVVVTENDGTIVAVGGKELLEAYPGLPIEVLSGVLCPGFINTHCHLELSCMKGHIQQGTGMVGFISEFVKKRNLFTAEESKEAIQHAEKEMLDNGIVAVGDIANTNHTFEQKSKANLYYHTFLEAFDLHPSRAAESFLSIRKLREELVHFIPGSASQSSVVPHAPYTMSPALHEKISAYAHQQGSILSIHSLESAAEDELFRKGTGPFTAMFAAMKMDHSWFKAPGQSSLPSTLSYYNRNKKLLLVHNTYATVADMQLPSGNLQLFWATCPKANLYIESRLPDYEAMISQKLKVTIGTDSLASNNCLSMLEEMKTISAAHPSIPLATLIQWACLNGAEFLGIDKQYGSVEKGKKPGLVLISGMEAGKLTAGSKVKRII